eukprot:3845568-Lingulodinium_polyedra.AAC.1
MQNYKGFLPQRAGCYLFESQQEGRLRCFYTLDNKRMSVSASIKPPNSLDEAMRTCLKWSWARHAEVCGDECPWEF